MKKAIGYARISDDDQSRWSTGGQQDLIREHCIKEKIELTTIFTDEGESAKNFDRANWRELEKFVKKNHLQVDYLFVMAYTRFSRNTAEALQMIEQLETRYHIRVLSITEPLHMHPDSPYYKYMRRQIIHNGELELDIIRDRTRFGIHHAQKTGRFITRPPKGYIRAKDIKGDPIIVIDQVKAPLIKEAFQRFINGETIISIRKTLKEKGLIIKGNSDLQALLQHPVYMGWIKQIAYYDNPETIVKGIHEPIIAEDDWWRVQAIFNNKNKLQRNILSEDFPLRGVLMCNNYHPLTAAFSKGRSKVYGYYKCNTDKHVNHSAKQLHDKFDDMLEELSLQPQHIEYLSQSISNNIQTQLQERSSSSEKIRQQLTGIEKKISNLEEKFIIDAIEPDTYKKWKSNYHTEKSTLADQLASLLEPVDQIWKRYDTSLTLLSTMHWTFHQLSLEDKQGFVREVFNSQLRYHNGTYRTTFLLSPFQHKALILKEKGLLIYEPPPIQIGISAVSAPQRSTIEPIFRFLEIIHKIKVA